MSNTGKNAQAAEAVVEQTQMKSVKAAGYTPVLIPAEAIMNRLVDAETGMEMTTSYRTKEEWAELKNQPIRCFFMGVEDAETSEGNPFRAASFISGEKVFVAGQKVLVDAVENLPVGQGVEITYLGDKKNQKGGRTLLFSVKRLKVSVSEQLQTAEAEEGATHE